MFKARKAEYYKKMNQNCLFFLAQRMSIREGNLILNISRHEVLQSVFFFKLRDSLENDLTGNINIFQFEKMYKEKLIRQHKLCFSLTWAAFNGI